MGVVYIILGWLFPLFGYLLGYLIYFPIHYILQISQYFGGVLMFSPPDWMRTILILVFLLFFVWEIFASALQRDTTLGQKD
jgi:hypothetical protein